MPNLYEILEISKDATADDIKRAYKRLALRWHPDKNLDNKEEAEERFRQIALAYQVLSDTTKRREYDRAGLGGMSSLYERGCHSIFKAFLDPNELFRRLFGSIETFPDLLAHGTLADFIPEWAQRGTTEALSRFSRSLTTMIAEGFLQKSSSSSSDAEGIPSCSSSTTSEWKRNLAKEFSLDTISEEQNYEVKRSFSAISTRSQTVSQLDENRSFCSIHSSIGSKTRPHDSIFEDLSLPGSLESIPRSRTSRLLDDWNTVLSETDDKEYQNIDIIKDVDSYPVLIDRISAIVSSSSSSEDINMTRDILRAYFQEDNQDWNSNRMDLTYIAGTTTMTRPSSLDNNDLTERNMLCKPITYEGIENTSITEGKTDNDDFCNNNDNSISIVDRVTDRLCDDCKNLLNSVRITDVDSNAAEVQIQEEVSRVVSNLCENCKEIIRHSYKKRVRHQNFENTSFNESFCRCDMPRCISQDDGEFSYSCTASLAPASHNDTGNVSAVPPETSSYISLAKDVSTQCDVGEADICIKSEFTGI